MPLHVSVVVTFSVAPTVICMTCCSGAGVGHLWFQCRKGGGGGQPGAWSCIDVQWRKYVSCKLHGAVSPVGLLSTQIQSTEVFCGSYRSACRTSQRMQYSGFLPMRSKSNFANSYGGPRLSRRGFGGGGVCDRLYKQQEQLRIYTKVKFYTWNMKEIWSFCGSIQWHRPL